jgi:hypothetical protein
MHTRGVGTQFGCKWKKNTELENEITWKQKKESSFENNEIQDDVIMMQNLYSSLEQTKTFELGINKYLQTKWWTWKFRQEKAFETWTWRPWKPKNMKAWIAYK